MFPGPEAITAHLDSMIGFLEAGDDEQARIRAHQARFDLQRLRAITSDQSKGGSGFMIAAVKMGMDLGKVNDLDRSIQSVINLINNAEIAAALEECEIARERWLGA